MIGKQLFYDQVSLDFDIDEMIELGVEGLRS